MQNTLRSQKKGQKGIKKAHIIGMNHIALEVDDVDEALDFYGNIFEFRLRGRHKGMAFIDMGPSVPFSYSTRVGRRPFPERGSSPHPIWR